MEEARTGVVVSLQEALSSYHNTLLQKVADHFKLNLEEVCRQFPIPANIGSNPKIDLKVPDGDSPVRSSRSSPVPHDDNTNQVIPNEQSQVKGSVSTTVPVTKPNLVIKSPPKTQKKPVKATKAQAKRVCKIPDKERCRARVWLGGGRCTRRRKDEATYCWNHVKGTPHGTIDDDDWVDPEASTATKAALSSSAEGDTTPQTKSSRVVSEAKSKPPPQITWEQVETGLGQPDTEDDLRKTVESKFGKKALTTYGKQLNAWWAQNKPVTVQVVPVSDELEEDGMQCEIRVIDGQSVALDTTTNKVYQVAGKQDYVGRWDPSTQQLDTSLGEWDVEDGEDGEE